MKAILTKSEKKRFLEQFEKSLKNTRTVCRREWSECKNIVKMDLRMASSD